MTSLASQPAGATLATALKRFSRTVYPPGQHLGHAFTWAVGVMGAMCFAYGRVLPVGPELAWTAAGLFCAMFFFRAVDEVKDLDYDRVHNPERALASGSATLAHMRLLQLASGGLGIAVSAVVDVRLAAFLAASFAYGLLLLWLERLWPRLGDSLVAGLFVANPIHISLNAYAALAALLAYDLPIDGRAFVLVLTYNFAFLAYELLRKTAWSSAGGPAQRLYSNVFGPRGSAALIMLFALAAAAGMLWTAAPWERSPSGWLHLAPPLAMAYFLARFVRRPDPGIKNKPKAVLYFAAFYNTTLLWVLVTKALALYAA